jgi:integrase
MKATKKIEFPYTVEVEGIAGITAKVYRQTQEKGGTSYESFVLSYNLLGQRKQERFNEFALAEAAGQQAIKKIAHGEQAALELRNSARYEYQRAKDLTAPLGVALDVVAQVYADCIAALGGKGNPVDACRDFAKRHGKVAAKSTVLDAVKKMIEQEEQQRNGKRRVAWAKLLKSHLENKFAADFNTRVDQLEPAAINAWLTKLDCAERTKKNIRDCLKHFFKFCRVQGYLDKDADLLADVQDFRKRKRGKIHTLTPEDLSKLMSAADDELVPYLALRAFAGLRDAEAAKIDWKDIDLKTGWIEITEEVAKASDNEEGCRRIVPIRDCLKTWLTPYVKPSGRVCPFANTAKQIAALCKTAGVKWRRNCLRHSQISFAVAETKDIPAVAIHSGNSPAVVKQSYWNPRVTPEQAKAWFNVLPVASVPDEKMAKISAGA